MLEPALPPYALDTLLNFIRHFVEEKKVVVGLSGGLDSSTVVKLCVMALGKEKVLGVHMPDKVTPKKDSEDAEKLAEELGIEYRVIEIDEIVEKMDLLLHLKRDISKANLKARIRMSILYAIANEESRLVAGTSNKSELLVGYFTKYGDGASDFAPIGDLYKTQVRELAKEIGVPENIIKKAPTAGLLPGQTDEKELGINYDTLDRILFGIELGFPVEKTSEKTGVDVGLVRRVYEMHERSRHKRVLLYIPKIGVKTVNTDWRE